MAKRPTQTAIPGEQAALLAAIIRVPNDDTPRLVYADWLDENGQPERAEFIRLQCRIDRSRPGDQDEGEQIALEDRADELLDRYGNEWTTDFRRRGLRTLEFRRGFVEDVAVAASSFLTHGEGWVRQSPIRKLTLSGVYGRAGHLVAMPATHSVAELYINDPWFDDVDFAALVSRPARRGPAFYPRLEALRIIARFGVGTPGLVAFAGCGGMPRLRSLTVRLTRAGDPGAAALAGARGFSALRSIDLFRSHVGSDGLVALAGAAPRGGSYHIGLGSSRVTADAFPRLAGLPGRSGFTHLDLDGNLVTGLTADQVGAVLANFPALRLGLEWCPLPDAVIQELHRRFPDRVLVTRLLATRDRRIRG